MAIVTYDDEVHAIPVYTDYRGHVIMTPHGSVDGRYSKDCLCKPIVNWHSAAAPLPLYEHRPEWHPVDA